MQTFSRLLSVVTLVLSFGFLAQALPIPTPGNALAARQYGSPESYGKDNNYGGNSYGGNSNGGSEYGNGGEYGSQAGNQVDVLALLADLKAHVEPAATLLAAADNVESAKIQVNVMVVAIKSCVSTLTGKTALVEQDVKVKIAQLVFEIFLSIVSACSAVSVKLGVSVCLSLWASIDIALHLLLLTLNVCIGGLLQLIVALFASVDVSVLAQVKVLHLDLCVAILQLVAKIGSIAL
ncbi:hypothetical protein BDV93DRAFT_606138 [Ceratobasidium sp. AG-I]|nr:hypothetical protein BDV93DRAFT_606138 [Ceratobasidium sp. AG-I]